MKPTESAEAQWNRKEFAIVSAVVIVVSLILWWRFLPLPEGDLFFYTEPAYLLAKAGTLAGPGLQYFDLTYQKGIYNYPPGYYLILAGWIKLFGLSNDSLLAFTHLIHSAILISLWALIRFRYACPRLISTLTLVSIFPKAPHGRPDMLACFLGISAWLALPADKNWSRLLLSGALAGAALLVSPPFGVGGIVTLAVLIALDKGFQWKERLRRGIVWLGIAALTFAGITAAVLAWQHSWTLAYVQFTANVAIRGKHLNQLPDFWNLFLWVFGVVPFILVAVLPAIIVVFAGLRDRERKLRDVTLAFLGAAAVWFALNKSQLLVEHHYLFVAKYVFLAVLCSHARFPLWSRILPLILLSAIGWYLYKANYIYLTVPLRTVESRFSPDLVPPGERSVDSLYFVRAYKQGRTLDYYPLRQEAPWPAYRAAIPPKLRATILSGLPDAPAVPTVFLVSAYSVVKSGEPTDVGLTCTKTSNGFEHLRLLGRTWNLPANPYALMVCTGSIK